MTKLGLLSDTHGRADSAEAAVQLLLDAGADVLIHLGDVGSTGVIDALAVIDPATDERVPAHMVLGNTDWDAHSLSTYARDLDVTVHEPSGKLVIDGKQIVFTHGHHDRVNRKLLAAEPDYLLHGHTHVQADAMRGKTRVINPGALFRASRYTVALLEPATAELQVVEVASVTR